MDEAVSRAHTHKKNFIPRLCESNVCRINSPSHAYAMQKAKTREVCVKPQDKGKEKKKYEIVSSLETSEGEPNTQCESC